MLVTGCDPTGKATLSPGISRRTCGLGRTTKRGAGDATTVPYKQIVVAMGQGAEAGLSAFDYLIRTEPAEEIAQAA